MNIKKPKNTPNNHDKHIVKTPNNHDKHMKISPTL